MPPRSRDLEVGASPATSMFAQKRPQMISGGLITAGKSGDQRRGGRGRRLAAIRDGDEVVDEEEPEQCPEGPEVGRGDQLLAAHSTAQS